LNIQSGKASQLNGDKMQADDFLAGAEERKAAVNQYFYN
jgi:hypothetical protein